MKVVIAGGGAVGTFIGDELQRAGHTVHIIELDERRTERARASGEHAGVEWHAADACEVDSLRTIGLDDADVVAAVTGDDEDNLVISLLAKQEFAVPRVVARVNNPKNEWLFNENWGVDVAVSTPHLLTALVEEAVSVGSLVRLLSFEGGRASLIEVTLAPGTPAAARRRHTGRSSASRDSRPRSTGIIGSSLPWETKAGRASRPGAGSRLTARASGSQEESATSPAKRSGSRSARS